MTNIIRAWAAILLLARHYIEAAERDNDATSTGKTMMSVSAIRPKSPLPTRTAS